MYSQPPHAHPQQHATGPHGLLVADLGRGRGREEEDAEEQQRAQHERPEHLEQDLYYFPSLNVSI